LSIRPKLFLTFAALCIAPLLVLSSVNLFTGLKNTERLLRKSVEDESVDAARHFGTLFDERVRALQSMANGPLPDYVRNTRSGDEVPVAIKELITNLPGSYASLAGFDAGKHQLFLAEHNLGSWTFRTRDFIPGSIEPDQYVWSLKPNTQRNSIVHDPRLGDVWRCSVPIFVTAEQNSSPPRGALVGDTRLDQIFETIDKGEFEILRPTRRFIVLDSAQRIVYHENEALKNQTVAVALPSFSQIAAAMTAPNNDGGAGEFRSAEGETWLVTHRPVFPGLSLAVARNYSLASQSARRAGWLGIIVSLIFGSLAALLITVIYQRKSQSLDRVTEGVAAIAKGKLDEELLLRSSDEMRGLAENVNLMTERLREQLARETETRHFNSFVKLSAMLAHDLKNAIEGLSLMVGNMERHFDNPKFRADAMQALTAATDKLRHLVARLSNPINTLSGEFKMPRATDLVPLLQRVVKQIAEPLRDRHEVDIQLPPSLFALADSERMEKVMENLVLNAVEAMGDKPGKLTIAAGTTADSKVFFSIADTGPGMSAEFIQQRLFRPFSTTKAQGVGLGLYTCREVVRANGGVIEVESKPGSGTSFRVVLASVKLQ